MTNREAYNRLTSREKKKYNETYSSHPLAAYIDWEAFYDSENGNSLDFVNCIAIVEIEGCKIYVLQKMVDNFYCYNSTENKFIELPVSMFEAVNA